MFAAVTTETAHAQSSRSAKNFTFGMSFRWVVKALFCCLSLCALLLAGAGSAAAQAAFFTSQQTVSSSFNSPCAAAVDSSGNVFVSDFMGGKIYEVVAVNGSVSSSSTVNSIASLSYPCGLAFDASGNLYVGGGSGMYSFGGYLSKIAASNGVVSSSSTVSTINSSFSGARGIAFDAAGDLYVADFEGSKVYQIAAGTTTPVLVNSSIPSPYQLAVDLSGDVFVTTGTNGNSGIYEIIASSGTVSTSSTVDSLFGSVGRSEGVAIDGSGNLFFSVLGATTVSEAVAAGGVVTSSSTINTLPTNVPYTGALSLDGNGNIFVVDPNNGTLYEASAQAVNFGAVNVGSASPATTLTVTFTTAGTLGSWKVLTGGATGKDFTDAGTGSCVASTAYSIGDTCTINVTFSPKLSGLRSGAVTLLTSAGVPFANIYLNGAGTGPQVAFLPAAQSWLGASNSNGYMGMAVDGSGNIFAGTGGFYSNVVEIAAGGGTTTFSHQYYGGTTGAALDGAGNLFIAVPNAKAIYELTAESGYNTPIQLATGFTFNYPFGIAVDGAGNLFVVDPTYANTAVYKIPAAGGYTTVKTLSTSFSQPYGIAVDANGNIFVADYGTDSVKEMLAAGGYTTIKNLAQGSFSGPSGVTVDGNGNVIVADTGNHAIKEITAASNYTTVKTLASGIGQTDNATVDRLGNLYVGVAMATQVLKLDLADAPTLNFASTPMGETSSDSPQTVTLQNIGNADLSFPVPASGNNPSIATGFTLTTGNTGDCPMVSSSGSAGTLAANFSCLLPISFAPTAVASFNGSLAITDNTLNAASPTYATQSIALNGTGTLIPQTITITGLPASALYDGVNLVYTLGGTSTGGSGNSVVFSITAGGSIASLSGNTLTITGTGLVTIQADQAAGGNYAAGTAQQSIPVIADTPASIAVNSGSPQSAHLSAAFTNSLVAQVTGTSGLPMAGATVTFTAPSTGASATLSSSTAVSDVTGNASVTATANMTAGSYNVTASVAGVSTSASFSLTNLPPPAFTVTTLTDDATGTAANCNDTSTGATPNTGCSLRDAIAAAAAASTATLTPTVNFASSLNLTTSAPGDYNVTTGGTLNVNGTMNIVGPGANLLSLDGGNAVQVLSTFNGTIAISGLTITNGNAGSSGAGGIVNSGSGTLTVTNSTISNNSSMSGGGIDNFGTLTLVNSTMSDNVTTGGGTGCIYNIGALVVNNSTLYANPSGVYTCITNQPPGTLTMTNSLVAGSYSGAGIYNGNSSAGAVKLANSLVNFFGGVTYTDNGGNKVLYGGGISLGYYGGTTQTMPPLPGDSAICAGTLANATAAGLTTDQRGNPRSTMAYGSTACVDAGPVQSAYSLSFAASPSTPQNINTAFTPAPTVQLNDLNPATGQPAPIALSGTPITVALYSGTLAGTMTQSTDATGLATFSNLIVPTAQTSDYLIASAPVGSYTITANSGNFDVDLLPQTITIGTSLPTTAIYNGMTLSYATNATSTSGGAVTFTLDNASTPGIASVTGGQVNISGVGTVIVDANQAGYGSYMAAPQVQQTITVSPDMPASIVVSAGSNQSVRVGSAFANNLTAVVTDAGGAGVYGATVTFAAPTTGASATFSSPTAVTDINGNASVTATANATAGSYNVTASASGASASASFSLTNLPPPVFTVTTLTDDASGAAANCNDTSTGATPNTGCSLRDAIAAAAAASTATLTPTVNFASSLNLTTSAPGDYNVTTGGTLAIGNSMNIVGPDANLLNIDGGNAVEVFNFLPGSTVSISGLTITKGFASANNGGGIGSSGTLTVANCTISNNAAGGFGGGIYVSGSSDTHGVLAVTGSTFINNSANGDYGGGIWNSGVTTVTNSTFTGNSAPTVGNGAGGAIGSGFAPWIQVTITNSTISGNTAADGSAGIYGGGVSLFNDVVTDSVSSGTPSGNGNVTSGVNLAALGYYGGTTQTMMPLPGSAAICAGLASNTPSGLTTDQRGYPRSTTAYGSTTCVDAGAVQTAYSLAFITSPSASQKVNVALTPASVVHLFDNGIPIALSGAPITAALYSGTLAGTAAQSTDLTGVATFSNLTVPTAQTSDYLIASAPVGSYTITANSSDFNVIAITLSPASGALTAGTYGKGYEVQFTASGGTPPFTYTATNLPSGMGIVTSTGVLSGIPYEVSGANPFSFTITVTDAVSNSVSQSYTLAVGQAASAVSVTSSANPAFVNNTVTYTAAVGFASGSGTTGPTGSVTFYDGSTPITACSGLALGAYNYTSGAALATCTVSYTSASPSTHTITASYTGDANFIGSTSGAFTEAVTDFTITAQNATLTVVPGAPASYTFTVSPSSGATTFPSAVTLTVSGLPSGYTYSFSPSATIAAGAGTTTVTLTIQTVPGSPTIAQIHTGAGGNLASRLAPFSLALLLLPFAGKLRKTGKRFSRMISLLLLLIAGAAAMAGVSGCGSNTGFFSQAQKSYTVTVTATSGTLSRTSNVTLTVE
jgi:hypothetical protein